MNPAQQPQIPMPQVQFDPETTSRIQAAKAAGIPDAQIMQEATQYQLQKSATQAPTAPKDGGLANLLPLAGGIIGGIGGSFLDPVLGPLGTIGGGAAGSGFGEWLRQKFAGSPTDVGSIAKETALGGLGGVAGKALEPVFGIGSRLLTKALPEGLDNLGGKVIASQYNVPRTAARALDLNGTIDSLSKYGIHNIGDIAPAADVVTGADGVISRLTRTAVSQAGPVDTNGIIDMAGSIAQNPAIGVGKDKKFVDFIQKGLDQITNGGGINAGTIPGEANPSETFGFIQQLEKQASQINRIPAFQRSGEDIALKNGYQMMADELKTRLFQNAGADNALAKGLITPEDYQALSSIHPQLANEVASAQTVGDLRKIAAPFVKGSQLAAETEAGSQIGFNNVGGASKGVGKLVQNPLNILAVPLGSNAVNAGVGGVLKGAADIAGNATIPGAGVIPQVAGQVAGQAAGPLLPGGQPPPEQGMIMPPNPADAALASMNGGMGGMPTGMDNGMGVNSMPGQDPQTQALRQIIASLMFRRARTPSEMAAAFDFMNPQAANAAKLLSPQQQQLQANAQSGLRALNTLQTILQQDPNAPLKSHIPILSGRSPYATAAREAIDVYTRLRTGAALNKDEQAFYDAQLPQPFDSPQTIQYKISNLRNLYTKYAYGQQPAGSSPSSITGL